jgi:hypothetical protein
MMDKPVSDAELMMLNTDEARLALFQAIKAITIGNATDDKSIVANLAGQGIYLAARAPRPLEVGEGEVIAKMRSALKQIAAILDCSRDGDAAECRLIFDIACDAAMLAVSPAGQRGE